MFSCPCGWCQGADVYQYLSHYDWTLAIVLCIHFWRVMYFSFCIWNHYHSICQYIVYTTVYIFPASKWWRHFYHGNGAASMCGKKITAFCSVLFLSCRASCMLWRYHPSPKTNWVFPKHVKCNSSIKVGRSTLLESRAQWVMLPDHYLLSIWLSLPPLKGTVKTCRLWINPSLSFLLYNA